jgi:hypothetical protein
MFQNFKPSFCFIDKQAMINLSTFTVDLEDGTKLTITIEPVLIDLPGGKHFTGVYRITETDPGGSGTWRSCLSLG